MTSDSIDTRRMRGTSAAKKGVPGAPPQGARQQHPEPGQKTPGFRPDPRGRGGAARSVPADAPTGAGEARQARQKRAQASGFRLDLSADQLRAADMIMRGFHLRTDGLGMRTQSYGWQPRGSGGGNERWESEVMRRFLGWAVRAQGEGLSVAAALDVIVFGKSCRQVDRERRRRAGFARDNLLGSLDLYLQL